MTDGLLLGAILAGGLARRMGGGDKTLLPLAGRPLLAHVVDRLAPQCDAVVLSANGDPTRFAAFGLAVVPDALPDRPGPLAGLLAVLDHAAGLGIDDVVTVPGDAPFLPRDLVRRLRDARAAADAAVACAASRGRTHPVVGLWPVSLRDDLRHALSSGERGVGRFAARHGAVLVEWSTVNARDPFLNLNIPTDLATAERMLAGSAQASGGVAL